MIDLQLHRRRRRRPTGSGVESAAARLRILLPRRLSSCFQLASEECCSYSLAPMRQSEECIVRLFCCQGARGSRARAREWGRPTRGPVAAPQPGLSKYERRAAAASLIE